jgi:site-specific recombinase XerD
MSKVKISGLEPDVAMEMYLQEREGEVSDHTLQAHEYRLDLFRRWLAENGVESTADLTPRTLHRYRLDRKSDGLKAVSLRTQLQTIRVFLRFLAKLDAAREDLPEKLIMPSVDSSEQRR